ncbi:MAG: hypothetical protein ACFCUO_04245 [Rhodospirillales bacterium]
MLIAHLTRPLETAASRMWLLGRSDAETDAVFYDTTKLTEGERAQVDAAAAARTTPEGSILVLRPGRRSRGFEAFACSDPSLAGEARARAVVDRFERHLDANPDIAARTLVVPGCGSSPLGAAALGKTVADAIGRPVAAIVAGQTAIDRWWEALSGGLLMAPSARVARAFDRPIEWLAAVNPLAGYWARSWARELVGVTAEAATLFELLKRRLIDDTGDRSGLRDPAAWNLDLIVSHSKGNWAVQAALLAFELDACDRIGPDETVDRYIDVVTFGTWVDLPELGPTARRLFRYHQFLGTHDTLALINSSSWALARLVLARQFDWLRPAELGHDAEEILLVGRGHNLIESNDNHMPIERLLPMIRAVQ